MVPVAPPATLGVALSHHQGEGVGRRDLGGDLVEGFNSNHPKYEEKSLRLSSPSISPSIGRGAAWSGRGVLPREEGPQASPRRGGIPTYPVMRLTPSSNLRLIMENALYLTYPTIFNLPYVRAPPPHPMTSWSSGHQYALGCIPHLPYVCTAHQHPEAAP